MQSAAYVSEIRNRARAITVVELPGGTVRWTAPLEQAWDTAMTFSPDGSILATPEGSGNQAVRLWDTASWQEVLALQAPGSVFNTPRFSPDGNRIWAVSSDYILHVWAAPSWDEIGRAEARNAQR